MRLLTISFQVTATAMTRAESLQTGSETRKKAKNDESRGHDTCLLRRSFRACSPALIPRRLHFLPRPFHRCLHTELGSKRPSTIPCLRKWKQPKPLLLAWRKGACHGEVVPHGADISGPCPGRDRLRASCSIRRCPSATNRMLCVLVSALPSSCVHTPENRGHASFRIPYHTSDLLFWQTPLSLLARGHGVPDIHRGLATRVAPDLAANVRAVDDHTVRYAMEYEVAIPQHLRTRYIQIRTPTPSGLLCSIYNLQQKGVDGRYLLSGSSTGREASLGPTCRATPLDSISSG